MQMIKIQIIVYPILNKFPDYDNFRDIYYDDFGNDDTPICIELSRFETYCWSQSKSWSDNNFKMMWNLIYDFLKLDNHHLNDCVETAFIEHLEAHLFENHDPDLIDRWINNMPDFVYALSGEWRNRRDMR